MHEWAKRAMASAELLISEVISPFSWVGNASAMPCRMFCGLRGLFAMLILMLSLALDIVSRQSFRNSHGKRNSYCWVKK